MFRTFGFTFDDSVFQEHSWYFRNALVRANYNNYSKGISATTSFLELFFRNLLFGEKNELHNRALHIAAHIGKSLRTVKRMPPSLIEHGLLERENGKRNGK